MVQVISYTRARGCVVLSERAERLNAEYTLLFDVGFAVAAAQSITTAYAQARAYLRLLGRI